MRYDPLPPPRRFPFIEQPRRLAAFFDELFDLAAGYDLDVGRAACSGAKRAVICAKSPGAYPAKWTVSSQVALD